MKLSFYLLLSIICSLLMDRDLHASQQDEQNPTARSGSMPKITLIKRATDSTIAAFLKQKGVDTTNISKKDQINLLRFGEATIEKKKAEQSALSIKDEGVFPRLEAAYGTIEIERRLDEGRDNFIDSRVRDLTDPMKKYLTLTKKSLPIHQGLKKGEEGIVLNIKTEKTKVEDEMGCFYSEELRDDEDFAFGAEIGELPDPGVNYHSFRKPKQDAEEIDDVLSKKES